MSYIIKQPYFHFSKFAHLLAAHIGAGVSLVLINVFLANYLSQAEFGTFVWIYAASMIFSQVAIFGSGTYYLNKNGQNNLKSLPFFHSGPSFIIFNFIFLCALIWFSITLLDVHDDQYIFFGFFSSLILVQICQEIHILRCQVKNLYKLQSIIFFTPHALRLFFILIAFNVFHDLSFKLLISLLVVINFLIFLLYTFKWRILIELFFRSISFEKYTQHFKNVYKRGLAEALFMIYTQTPVILIAYAYSVEEAGIFAISITFATIFLLPSAVFTKAFSPILYEEANKSKKLHYRIVINFLFALACIGLLMGLGLYLLSDPMVAIFLDKNFIGSVTLIKVLSVFIFARYLNTAISYSMYTHNFSVAHAKILFVAILLQLIFFFLSANFSMFDLNLVAWMMCAIEFLIFFITLWFLKSTAFKLT